MDLMLVAIVLASSAFVISQRDDDVLKISVVRGQNTILNCRTTTAYVVNTGETVNWYKNGEFLEKKSPGEATALRLPRVTSQDAGMYCCRIFGEDKPSRQNVYQLIITDFHGPPIIMFSNNASHLTGSSIGPFREGSQISLHCEVEDSHPSTNLRWYRNDEAMVYPKRTHTGLSAELTIKNMSRDEHRVRYECRAESQNFTKSAGFSVQMTLPPLNVSILTDHNDAFEAGNPRVLACVVYGCVPAPIVTWYLGNTMLKPNVYKEVNRGNYTVSSLTFVPSLSDNGKELVCQVTNDHIAQTFEDRITVSVGSRPTCLDSEYKNIGAVEGDSENLVCTVESFPAPGQFIWTFADSRTIYTSSKKVRGYNNRYSTTLNWVPHADDFGPLYCRAINRFGEQKEPCTFSVIAGGPPTTPHCQMFWEDQETLKVRCDKNWDGGRPQTIHVKVASEEKVVEVSEAGQEVRVKHIQPGANVTAVVFASNCRGNSASLFLTLSTNHTLPTELPQVSSKSLTWFHVSMVVIVMFVAFIVLVVISVYILDFWGSRHPTPQVSYHLKQDDSTKTEETSCSVSTYPSKYFSFESSALRIEDELEECRCTAETNFAGVRNAPESTRGLGDRYEFCV